MKAAIYIRVSTQEQVENYSIQAQTEKLTALCRSKDWDVYDTFIDGGYSGSNMNRPALNEMLSKLHEIDAVVVYRLDRLSRSQKDTITLIEEYFLKNNVEFVSLSETLDTSSPFGRAMIGILSVFAQLERETIRDRMVMGQIKRVESGLPLTTAKGRTFGYNVVDAKLYINEEEAKHLQLIYDIFEEEKSITFLQKKLKELGFKVKSYSSYNKWLMNDLYIGYVSYSDKVHVKGIHEPIISEDQFYRVQEIFSRMGKNPNMNKESSSLLNNLIVCEKCGLGYVHRAKDTVSRGKKYHYRYYSCKTYKHTHELEKCGNKIWRADKLEEIIISRVKNYSFATRNLDKEDELDSITEKLKTEHSKKKRLFDLYINGTYEVAELDKMMADIDAQINYYNSQIEANKELKRNKKVQESLAELATVDFDSLEFREKQIYLKSIINKIYIDGEQVTIEWI
ncbi:recombinase family protein [Listeria monocytogenes]|uniref:recombinase family protein n=1 Tax=Listeria monocytogenes TaxID=1639 RepID=UPI000BE04AFF|nr:recombinase family protein [Listeria monocytogenes]EAH2945285.1 recombinase family protein [Listeria monocytogenes]EGM8710285.1 recombinase family protein [Listeria monocytogenes]EGM8721796.1 recombinase family protein [Listeria monocytogenes]EGM8726115.1 recombinase family protein [Listeria monocytogenes]EGM8736034.1 recombinase family protein [Listeria monocytogenes]